MRTYVLAIILALSLVSTVKAQNANDENARRDEEAKETILKIEKAKIPALIKGGAEALEWYDRYNSDDLIHTKVNGVVFTKARDMEELRSGELKVLSINDEDFNVRIYNGDTAIATYRHTETTLEGPVGQGVVSTHYSRSTDSWIKQNGEWRRVVHTVISIPKSQ